MVPIELASLSGNWKKLQATLKSAKSPPTKTPPQNEANENHQSLKRKRGRGESNGADKTNPISLPVKSTGKASARAPLPRKRQKMEEPSSIGASTRHNDPKALSRSVSMPSLHKPPLLSDPAATADSASILTPHPDHPDIENEGVSSTALPGKYIALDCEMVGYGPDSDRDSMLARVSVVNYHGHQVYDSFVRPTVPVTDYRTAISGIEPRHLKPDVARPFKEVQSDIRTLLQGRILVGHALKNDLKALILGHEKRMIRDTSKYSGFRALAPIPKRTPGLKYLAEKLLGVQIQTGRHSSVEDARATMALFRLEKDAFEEEVRKLYGNVKPSGAAVDIIDGTPVKRKSKNKKKKKKKKA